MTFRTSVNLSILAITAIFALGAAYLLVTGSSNAKGPASATGPYLETVDSVYNTINVSAHNNLRLLSFNVGGKEYFESAYNVNDPNELVFAYTRYMSIGLAYASTTNRAAFIGFGGGRTASYIVTTIPTIRLEAAELDPEVVRLSEKHLGLTLHERINLSIADGRIFLSESEGEYDVIFLDAYRGTFVPFHLMTTEFYALTKEKLAKGGVVVQNVDPTTLVLDRTIATLYSVFDHVDAYPIDGSVILVAYAGEGFDTDTLTAKAEAFDQAFSPRYPTKPMTRSRATIPRPSTPLPLTDDFAPVELLSTIERNNEKPD